MTLAEQILTIAICALATMATRFLPFLVFSRRPADAAAGDLSWQGAAVGDLCHARRLQPAQCGRAQSEPRLAGTFGHRRHCGAASLETTDARFHRWRHRVLHAARAARFLILLRKALVILAALFFVAVKMR